MKHLRKIGLNILFLFFFTGSHAQIKHWVFFEDKGNPAEQASYVSARTYAQRHMLGLPVFQATDIPVHSGYLQALNQLGIQVHHTSKWLNAASAVLLPEQAQGLEALPFVKAVVPFQGYWQLTAHEGPLDSAEYGLVMAQIEGQALLAAGLDGSGVPLGIIDGGFIGAQSNPYLQHFFETDQIAAYKDFQNPGTEEEFFTKMTTFLDWHGTSVWAAASGYHAEKNEYLGPASGASFYLARTEHGTREYRGEQDLILAGIEWLDSLGVRLVNISLGYTQGFDDEAENYTPDQMDGRSVVAQGLQIAVNEKGIIVVTSAGNEGNDSWRLVGTPGDARDVISVGATNSSNWIKMGYSSEGPEYLDYIKPEVSVYSSSGTSFAAPAVAGIVACMLQKDSTLTPAEAKRLLMEASHLQVAPNNYLGAGVPNMPRLLALMDEATEVVPEPTLLEVTENTITLLADDYPWIENKQTVFFHQTEATHVDHQELLILPAESPEMDSFVVTRPSPDIAITTVAGKLPHQIIQIYWPEVQQ